MIQREDLVAAAAAGLLQYRQVDPLLIFLLQKDVRAKRAALHAQLLPAQPVRRYGWFAFLAAVAAIVVAALVAVMFTVPAVKSAGIGALFFFTLFYALGAFGLSNWFKRCGLGVSIRIPSALMITVVPLAVFMLRHIG